MTRTLAAEHPLTTGSPYVGYLYAYPHKTAYRSLDPPVPLDELWQTQPRDSLFLYLHVPFCEHRCGFCNLFATTRPERGLVQSYLHRLREEARRVRAALGEATFVRCAFGGGTPTFPDLAELGLLLDVATDAMGADLSHVPASCEMSPATVDVPKLELLRSRGIDRASLGVQSFDERDAQAMGRPQQTADVHRALESIRDAGFPVLNVDLIYGGEGQTVDRFAASVRAALRYAPEEIYLYPLYVRPLTGLGRRSVDWDDQRRESYRAGRDLLLDRGYEQVSMRMFRLPTATTDDAPAYCCQTDGMIGLGCGARSYAGDLHYSTEYAVSRGGVKRVLADYLARDPSDFEAARHGDRLPIDDQRRRFAIQSLLQVAGLDRDAYRDRFGTDVGEQLPELAELAELDLATIDARRIVLTPAGLELSDVIGPWLISPRVRSLMDEHVLE